ncbi:MAG: hypothetical protein JSU01_22615 [Bacteroidetes bacterium]|nr:hypothetical protein [Bacteroidota bacterium]
MSRKLIVDFITGLLILLFSYAAVSKLLTYRLFIFQLSKSPFTSSQAHLISWLVPSAELLIVMLLVVKRTRTIGLYGALFLMALFTAYIYALLHFSYYVPCSCGGVIARLSWNQHLVFNLLFTSIALVGALLDVRTTGKPT